MGYAKIIGHLTITISIKKDEDVNDYPDWDSAVDMDEGRWN